MKHKICQFLWVLLIVSFAGCTSIPFLAESGSSGRNRNAIASFGGGKQNLVVEGALSLIGKDVLAVNGKTFPMDCTGVVRAAYWHAGIDIAQDFGKYSGNGVSRIHQTLKSKFMLYSTKNPKPGDIVFWDNTYDKNEDGKWNDKLTHVGIVIGAARGGQLEYVHHNYRKGIINEYMNLHDPDTYTKESGGRTVTVNSAMRMKGQASNPLWLSSHLLREFGKGYLLK